MKSWWLSLLPVLVCAPCLAVSLGAAGVLTAGLVAAAGLLATPIGLALTLAALAAVGLGLQRVVHRRRCRRPLPDGGER
jgi:hypothetical protein